jgi:hypothetical protein
MQYPTAMRLKATCRASFRVRTADHRPLRVAEVPTKPGLGALGDLGFFHFIPERWGFMPRVARLEGVEQDLVLVLVGRRLGEPQAV